jgi:5-methylcytosine-specific restriction endonuclease McrA
MKIDEKISKRKQLQEQKVLDEIWAKQIKTRDGYECVICGNVFAPNAHHLVPREIKEYRYDLNNGITLCVNHHKFSRKLSAHNAPFAFHLWLAKYKPEVYYEFYRKTVIIAQTEAIL